ncbi:MAG: hypothetical protein J0I06_24925 [Planctomycetes bacterium]|nr:hypothetical protein [Planctomycetota bacterium]
MTLRRLIVATVVLCGLCVWGFAHSDDAPTTDPVRAEGGAGGGGTHDEAAARYRANQSHHWRHVAVGNYSMSR